jgi:hypothetical protein
MTLHSVNSRGREMLQDKPSTFLKHKLYCNGNHSPLLVPFFSSILITPVSFFILVLSASS